MTLSKWNKDRIIEAIRNRQHQGLSLKATWRENISLYSSAKRYCGSWTNALRTAGCDSILSRPLSRQDVLDAVHARDKSGLSMVAIDDIAPLLYSAAKRHFGGWHKAMLAAGLHARPRKKWTHQAVIAAIHEYHQQGHPLSSLWKQDVPLFTAAIRRFGNWNRALAAAGFPSRQFRRWTKERILWELRMWHRQNLSRMRVPDPGLNGAVVRFFGNFHRAWEATGLDFPDSRWSKKRLIEAIQDRYIRGLRISLVGFGESSLAGIAKRLFGGWREAVTAAGLADKLPLSKVVRTWTKEEVIAIVLERHRQGLRLTRVWEDDVEYYRAATKHFGTWHNTLRAAGLAANRKQWTKAVVIEEIRTWQRRGIATSSISRQDPRLTTAARRLFGCWHSALMAAGLDVTPGEWRRRSAFCAASVRWSTAASQASSLGMAGILPSVRKRERAMVAAGVFLQRRQP